MSTKVSLEHRTTYRFARPVNVAPHVVRLRPAPHCRTPIEAYSLEVSPANHFLNWQQDPFGNWLARLVFPEKVTTLEITVGPGRRPDGDQPVRLLHRGVRRALPVRLRAEPARPTWRRTCARSTTAPPAAAWREPLPALPGGRHADRRRSSPTSTPRSTATSPTPCGWSRACRRPTRRCARGIGSCRDSAWLLVQPAAAVRPGRPVRLRLPRPARRRRHDRGARRADAARARTSPTCTRGPRSTSPAPAGSAWTRPARCSPARATSRSARPRTRAAPRRSRARPSRSR